MSDKLNNIIESIIEKSVDIDLIKTKIRENAKEIIDTPEFDELIKEKLKDQFDYMVSDFFSYDEEVGELMQDKIKDTMRAIIEVGYKAVVKQEEGTE